MQTLPLDSTSQNDPTANSKIDGVTVTCCGDDMIVYGGWAADRIWRLNLAKATWTEVICTGSIPPAREFHTACWYGGHLLVCGGELMVSPKHGVPQYINYYELALDTYEWMSIECYGSVPTNRSHHTAVMSNDSMIVFGGKQVDGKPLTNGSLAENKRVGFYDIFVLHVISRTWKRVEMYDPKAPMLWGHSCVCFRDTYLLFFGGFDVSSNDFAGSPFVPGASNSVDAAPIATLSDTVHILSVESWQWSKCTPSEKERAAPVPRALHVAQIYKAEMFVFGGFTVDSAGRTICVNDCWTWNVETGEWQRIEFCLPQWSTRKLLSCVYYDQLVIAHQLSSVSFLDAAKKGTGWQKVNCKTNARMVYGKAEGPRVVTDNAQPPTRQEGRTSPERQFPTPSGRGPNSSEMYPPIDDGLIGPTGEKITATKAPRRITPTRRHPPQQGGPQQHANAADRRRPFEVPKTLPEGFLSRAEVYESEVDVLREEIERLRTSLKEKEERSASARQGSVVKFDAGNVPPRAKSGSSGEGTMARWDDVAASYSATSGRLGGRPSTTPGRAAGGPRTTSPAARGRPVSPKKANASHLPPWDYSSPGHKPHKVPSAAAAAAGAPARRTTTPPAANRPGGGANRSSPAASSSRPIAPQPSSIRNKDRPPFQVNERLYEEEASPSREHPLSIHRGGGGSPGGMYRSDDYSTNGADNNSTFANPANYRGTDYYLKSDSRGPAATNEYQSSPYQGAADRDVIELEKAAARFRAEQESIHFPSSPAHEEWGLRQMPQSLVKFGRTEEKRQELAEIKKRKIQALQAKLDAMMNSKQMSPQKVAAIRQVMLEVQKAESSLFDSSNVNKTLQEREMEDEMNKLLALKAANRIETREGRGSPSQRLELSPPRQQQPQQNEHQSLMAAKRRAAQQGHHSSPGATPIQKLDPSTTSDMIQSSGYSGGGAWGEMTGNTRGTSSPVRGEVPRGHSPPKQYENIMHEEKKKPSPGGIDHYWQELEAAMKQGPKATTDRRRY